MLSQHDRLAGTREGRAVMKMTKATKRHGDAGLAACSMLMLCLGAVPALAAPAGAAHAPGAAAVAQTLGQRLGLKSMVAQAAPDCTGATGALIDDDGGFENAISAP